LERKLRNMFIMTRGAYIAWGQLAAATLLSAAGLLFELPFWPLGLPIVALAPAYYIEYMRKQRIRLIESKLDGFIITLANSLRATPSLGNALAYAQPLIMPPLNNEVDLVMKEMRVGNRVDQALMNMSARIQSTQLDSAIA